MRRLVIAAASFVLAAPAAGQSLFEFTLTETGNPSNTLTAGGSRLPDIANDFADTTGSFASFDGTAFSATMTYAGVPDAVSFTYDPAGGSAGGGLLTIDNLLGFGAIPAFDEANGDLGDQLQDFFLKDNPDAVSEFLQAVAERSLVAVTDGNPSAVTARSARYMFERFGLFSDLTPTEEQLFNRFSVPDEGEEATALPQHQARQLTRTRVGLRGQYVDAGGFGGTSLDLDASFELAFNEHVSFVLGVPAGYHEIEGADVYNVGLHLDAPIRLVIPEAGKRRGITWQVTPGVAGDFAGSYDFAAGGLLVGIGLNNMLAFHLDDWTFITAQQITTHEGEKLNIDSYEWDPGVSQRVLKLGGRVAWAASDKLDLYGGVTYTDFLEDAAVDNYWSPTAGIAWRFRNGSVIAVSYEGDFADDFERHGGRVEVQMPF